MGVRAAAAKWGSMANGTFSGLSLFMRRCSSLAATDEVVREKRLYLCFSEVERYASQRYRNQVVRPIRLTTYNDADDEEEYLSEAADKRFKCGRCFWSNCSTFGPQIVFPAGPNNRHVWSIDTSSRPIKFSPIRPCPKAPVEDFYKLVRLGNIDGKLYRFDNDTFIRQRNTDSDPCFNSFEVFDPQLGRRYKWRPLHPPPFISTRVYNVTFLDASKKILGWDYCSPAVYCFDTTKPENGWTEVTSGLGDTLPSLNYYNRFYNSPLFIHNYHPQLGDFHLYFHLAPKLKPLAIVPFYLSNNFDSFEAIDNPIQLPVLCLEYLPQFKNPPECISSDFEFVLLGHQKVGLLMNKFIGHDYCKYPGKVLLITFEYDISVTDSVKDAKPTVEIKIRLLGTRRFRYHGKRVHGDYYPLNHINGAFWL